MPPKEALLHRPRSPASLSSSETENDEALARMLHQAEIRAARRRSKQIAATIRKNEALARRPYEISVEEIATRNGSEPADAANDDSGSTPVGKPRGSYAQAVKARNIPKHTFSPTVTPKNVVPSTPLLQTARRELSVDGARFREAKQGLLELRASKARVDKDLGNARAAVQALEHQQD